MGTSQFVYDLRTAAGRYTSIPLLEYKKNKSLTIQGHAAPIEHIFLRAALYDLYENNQTKNRTLPPQNESSSVC